MEYDNLTDFCSDEQLAWLAANSCACCGDVFSPKDLILIDGNLFCELCIEELDCQEDKADLNGQL